MRRAPITCKELVELITDYVEGTPPRGERRRFQSHMRECDGCTTYLEQMRTTIRTVGSLTEASISPEARDELLHAFRDWRAQGAGA